MAGRRGLVPRVDKPLSDLQARRLAARRKAMTTFDERERAFENKFAHDEEMKFRAIARRNKMAGLWAADLLGKSGEEADAYAMEVVRSDFENLAQGDVVRKLRTDLGDRVDEAEIRAKLDEFQARAKGEILTEAG
jgi:hypothetical protein